MLVMATTSPEPLVTPFAERLGFDAVVATKWDAARRRLHRRARRRRRVGPGQAGGRRGRGPTAGRRRPRPGPGPTATATTTPRCSTPSATRRPSTPTSASSPWPGCSGWPLRHFDLPEGVLKIAGRELQDWTRPLQRPELAAQRPPRRRRASRTSRRRGPVIAVFNHRSYFDATVVGAVLGQTGRSVPLPRQEGGLRRPASSACCRQAGRRHPGQPGVGVRRAAGARHPRRSRPARPWRWRRRARSRAARRSSTRAEGPLGRRPPGPGDPRARSSPSGCGAPRRCGRATSACRGSTSREPPPIRVRVGDPVELQAPQPRRRHQADHGGARRPAARRGTRPAHADRGGAARPRSRPATRATRRRGRPPSRHRHLSTRGRRMADAATATTRAALRAADVRRRGVDVERREGPVAEPERRHGRRARPPARHRPLPRPDRRRRRRRAAPARAGRRPASGGSARPCGAPIPSSTSTTTSAGSPCRRRAPSASCSTSSPRSTRIRTTGPGRCGCSTSSRGWRAAAAR